MANRYAERLVAIRERMAREGWDALILTGSDPHSSEYVAERWQQVQWVCGFSGEAGDIVVTADHAGLWTDTRYFIQAEKQLPGTGFVLHKTNVPDQVLIPQWLAANVPDDREVVIAVDGPCQTVAAIDELRAAFGARRLRIVDVPDFLDAFWSDRPGIPQTPITTEGAFGRTRAENIAWIRDEMRQKGCDAILLTSLDEIAWLLNVRGSDIAYNPVVISYLIVSQTDVRWFVRKSDVVDDVTAASFAALEADGVTICRYDAILEALGACRGKLFVDPSTLNYSLHEALSASPCQPVSGESPVILRKAVKNDAEIAGMRKAHLADGLAVTRFLYWLEKELTAGHVISEWQAAKKLGEFRSACPDYRGDSFETISAWGAGAALPHYVTPHDDSTTIGNHGLYLVDSGGQYLYGTTDITRTVATGPCTELEKEDYTLAMQGHIRLAMCIFPKGTAGCQIDVLAREAMWRQYRNFGHGTGHGVGYYLNVHEGPQNIRQGFKNQPLLPGMITSNEPGLYREGMHGVRHENLVLCIDTGERGFGREWLAFDDITLCYFDTAPLIASMLHPEERDWLNLYNECVYTLLAPQLEADVAAWLREKTKAI